jgi:hypothetical protein
LLVLYYRYLNIAVKMSLTDWFGFRELIVTLSYIKANNFSSIDVLIYCLWIWNRVKNIFISYFTYLALTNRIIDIVLKINAKQSWWWFIDWELFVRTDTWLVFYNRKLLRTDNFFTRITKPICNFPNPDSQIYSTSYFKSLISWLQKTLIMVYVITLIKTFRLLSRSTNMAELIANGKSLII